MKKKKITLIKLGGSIITNKDIPMSLREEMLSRLVSEIAQARKELPDELFVVGHGQGSFAHVPASKYKTMNGFIDDESILGMAIVQDSAATLNRLVVHEFLRHEIPAVSFYASNTIATHGRKAESFCSDVFWQYLEKGLFPVTAGDVLVDSQQGCTIWSTEEILSFLAEAAVQKGYRVNRIIHVTEVDGFLNEKGKLVQRIRHGDWQELKKSITATKGFDVTGGMGLKIEESLALAKKKIRSYILSGVKRGNLLAALKEEAFVGTEIS